MIVNDDCLKHLKTLEENKFDSCVTDPPYHLVSIAKRFTNSTEAKYGKDGSFQRLSTGFMGQTWDGGDIAFQKEFWEQVYRVIKPGAVLLSFAATRNYHRMAVAVEDAGFEIFDMINWIYGTGFPKRKNYLKPAHEPIVMARKGLNKNLNIDDCRIELEDKEDKRLGGKGTFKTDKMAKNDYGKFAGKDIKSSELGRYPANVIHDGSEEVINEFAKYGNKGAFAPVKKKEGDYFFYDHKYNKQGDDGASFRDDTGTAARFFYSAKATKKEKGDTQHPTVKPLSLMRYLVKLVTPKEGLVLDPFAGTGTTGEACILENRKYYLIEREKNYIKDINKRLNKYGRLGI